MSKADPIFGVDISGWQRGIDLGRVKSEGYDFCIVKATEGPYPDGTSFTNPAYTEQMREAKAAGLIVGVYHFLVETPAKAQVDHFLEVVGDVAGKIVVVDYEAYPTAGFSHLDPTMKTLEAFVGELRRRIGDHSIVVYAGQGYWNSPPPNGAIKHLDVTTWDAWYQHMNPGGGPALYKEARTAGMDWGKRWGDQEPMLWQFSQAGKVAGMQIDVDAYQGTREQLLALAGGESAPRAVAETKPADPPATGDGAPKKAKAFWDAIDYLRPAIGDRRTPYWVWEAGIIPDGPGAFAISRPVPSIEYVKGEPGIFCLTGDTTVVAGPIEKSFRRFYEGEVVTIKTASGKKLTGSPNHPVLSDKGWIPLKLLRKGQNVIASPGFRELAGADENEYDQPTVFEQLHRSLANTGVVDGYPGSPLDFHGDGRKGEVDIVVTDRVLSDGREAPISEQIGKLPLSDAESAALSPPLKVVGPTPSGFVGGGGLREPAFGPEFDVPQASGLGAVASNTALLESVSHDLSSQSHLDGDLSFGHAAAVEGNYPVGVNVLPVGRTLTALDASVDKPLVDHPMSNVESFGNLPRGLPADVCRDEIVGVDVRAFSGHVYNLQTESGHYIANGIITHNCAGVTNLILRQAGKRVPTKGNLAFDGGIAAYFHGQYGDGYYTGHDETFDMAKAKKWADETNCGVMIGKGYYGAGLDDQGHVAVLLPRHTDGKYYVLQSYGGYPKWPGLNWDSTIEASHAGGYYKRMVHPENWLLYQGDEY
ncbi:MAG: GH25 family lysozyme [Rubrobacter sp.]